MRNTKIFLVGAGFAGMLFACGCLVVAAGAGGYYVVKGEVRRDYPQSLGACAAATQKALQSLGLKDISSTKDDLKASFRAKRADGDPVRVHLKRREDGHTQIRVRAGDVGNEEMGRVVHERIQKFLGA